MSSLEDGHLTNGKPVLVQLPILSPHTPPDFLLVLHLDRYRLPLGLHTHITQVQLGKAGIDVVAEERSTCGGMSGVELGWIERRVCYSQEAICPGQAVEEAEPSLATVEDVGQQVKELLEVPVVLRKGVRIHYVELA